MRAALSNSPLLEAIQGSTDINECWQAWTTVFLRTINPFIPVRHITLRPQNKPWMTSHLWKFTRQKHRLFQQAKRSRSPKDWYNYKTFRNKCTTAFRRAKEDNNARNWQLLENEIDGSQGWWSKAKALARLKSSKDTVPDLKCSQTGELVSTSQGKATVLARFFSQQCSSDVTEDLCGAPFPLPDGHPTFDIVPLKECDVLKKITKLQSSKATSDRIVSNRTLKECAKQICPSITYLFNMSLSNNNFPDQWKQAIVCPVYKQRGDASNPSNYRPISLLPAVGKLLDALVSERLLAYLLQNNLISCRQFGFLPQRSTVKQLVYIIDR